MLGQVCAIINQSAVSFLELHNIYQQQLGICLLSASNTNHFGDCQTEKQILNISKLSHFKNINRLESLYTICSEYFTPIVMDMLALQLTRYSLWQYWYGCNASLVNWRPSPSSICLLFGICCLQYKTWPGNRSLAKYIVCISALPVSPRLCPGLGLVPLSLWCLCVEIFYPL